MRSHCRVMVAAQDGNRGRCLHPIRGAVRSSLDVTIEWAIGTKTGVKYTVVMATSSKTKSPVCASKTRQSCPFARRDDAQAVWALIRYTGDFSSLVPELEE